MESAERTTDGDVENEIGADNAIPSRILKDAFHVMQMMKVSLKHGMVKEFARRLRDAIFVVIHQVHKKKVEDHLKNIGADWDSYLVEKPDYVLERVRRNIPPPQELYESASFVFEKYGNALCVSSGRPLFTPDNWQCTDRILKEIRLGHVSDLKNGPALYVEKGSDETGLMRYYCIRGTDSVEGTVHINIVRKFFSYNAGPRLASPVLADYRLYSIRPIFSRELYLHFERKLNFSLETTEEPGDLLMQIAIPGVEAYLQDLKSQMSAISSQVRSLSALAQTVDALPASIFQHLEPFLRVNNQAHRMMEQWERIVTQGASLNVRTSTPPPPKKTAMASTSGQDPFQYEQQSDEVSGENSVVSQDAQTDNLTTELTLAFNSVTTPLLPISPFAPESSTTAVVPVDSRASTNGLDITVMAFRNTETLPALWRIWFKGLPGHHPVCDLDKIYGLEKWRGSLSDSKFSQGRQKVIKKIQKFIEETGLTEDEALNCLEEKRKNNVTGTAYTIHKISEDIDEFFA
ncbi:unnamed protein product [Mucor hiemalis]